MVDRNLIREFSVDDDELEATFASIVAETEETGGIDALYEETSKSFETGNILSGVVLRREGDDVLVDVGCKSEGMVAFNEWEPEDEPPHPGQKIEVLLEEFDDALGVIRLSRRKAKRIRDREKIISTRREGDIVSGLVQRKIKGGLLVDIGVNVFLPASQVDIRRPADIGDYIGKTVECVILKIDEARRNIVVSRRKLIEDQREKLKKALLAQLKPGELRKGVVKNIADFGAFVDLGGIDGLLHITDMSYGRINHPTEMVKIDKEVEVMILHVDYEKEKIALGLKQKSASPWEHVPGKYPVGSTVKGTVVNVMSYGAFIELEPGIEGLVHISEMSWTRNVRHPSKLVSIGETIEAVVLKVDPNEEKISLGMKQTEQDPWVVLPLKYPVGTRINGKVRNLTSFGAFVEIEPGIDGLIHISDMSWTKRVQHPSEVVKKGDAVDVVILNIDAENKRISLGLKQAQEDPWLRIGETYPVGTELRGRVLRLMDKGVVVDIGNDIEGFIPMSQLGIPDISNPGDAVKEGQAVELKVLEVDPIHHRIVLAATGFPKDDIIPVPAPPPPSEDAPQTEADA